MKRDEKETIRLIRAQLEASGYRTRHLSDKELRSIFEVQQARMKECSARLKKTVDAIIEFGYAAVRLQQAVRR